LSAAIAKLIAVDGWTLDVTDDEPTILDVELGSKLGLNRPRDIRKLVERLVRDGKLNDIRIRAAVARIELRPGVHREQVVNEYWLTEKQALKVIAKSETTIADSILDEVIEVFTAVRRGRLAPPYLPPNSPDLGDSLYREDIKARCVDCARRTEQSTYRVQGWLRALFGVSSVYRIVCSYYADVCRRLDAWASGRESLPSRARRPKAIAGAVDPRQGVLPFPDKGPEGHQ